MSESRSDIDLFQIYRADVMRYPLLTAAETLDSARGVLEGVQVLRRIGYVHKFVLPELTDTSPEEIANSYALDANSTQSLECAYKSFDNLVVSNLRYVISLAKPFADASGQPIMDIIQEGNLGLVQGLRQYDCRKGFTVLTYVNSWIRDAMARGIDNTGSVIHVPVQTQKDIRRMGRAEQKLVCHRAPGLVDVARLAVEMNVTEDKIREVQSARSIAHPNSLSQPTSHGSNRTVEDSATDTNYDTEDDVLDRIVADDILRVIYAALADRPELLDIVNKSFGLGGCAIQTQLEIATELGLTHQAISRRLKRATEIVREYAEINGLTTDMMYRV